MALTKITKTGITADAVDATKIADNAISEEHLDTTVVTGQPDLGEAAATGDFVLIYDTSAGVLKKVSAGNVGTQSVTLTSISPTNAVSGDGTGNHTFTLTGTNLTGATALLVTNGGAEVNFDTVTVNSATQITAVIAKSSITNANEPYDVKVFGSNGTQAILRNQINIDASPIFTTASGLLGTSRFSMSGISVNATDPDSAGNVTFELQSGSLPAGISLVNNATEGGTATFSGNFSSLASSNTTYNFVLRAVDAASNTSSRAFSFTALGPQITSFTSSGTFAAPTGLTSVDVLLVAGGGGGGGAHPSINAGGGGGAGGLVFFPSYPVTTGTVTVTVGDGGAAGGAGAAGTVGQDSAFGSPGDPGLGQGGVLTAKGGGLGSGGDGAGGAGGSGGGGSNAQSGGATNQPTQPGNSGAYGFGNAGATGAQNAQTGGSGGGGSQSAGIVYAATSPNSGGHGGAGKAYTIADGTTPVTYAGGGGGGGGYNNTVGWVSAGEGGGYQSSNNGGGGNGAGGRQASDPVVPGQAGQANKGGGGGGGQLAEPGTPVGPQFDPGGAGGKGIVVVKF
jgi:hypothetical protein